MDAWADHQQVGRDGEGTMINFLADPHGNWTDACGLRMCHDGPHDHFGQGRSKRYSAFFDDCKLVKLNIAEASDDPAGDEQPGNSLADKMIEFLSTLP